MAPSREVYESKANITLHLDRLVAKLLLESEHSGSKSFHVLLRMKVSIPTPFQTSKEGSPIDVTLWSMFDVIACI